MSSQKPGTGWVPASAVFQLGKGKRKSLAIPFEIHQLARSKLVAAMGSMRGVRSGVVLLKGGQEISVYDSDTTYLFRQDSWFQYLFGVKEPDMYGAINLSTGLSTLFIPKLGTEYSIWCGAVRPPQDFQLSYTVDEVLYVDDMENWLTSLLEKDASGDDKIYLLDGINSDSGLSPDASFPSSAKFCSMARVNTTHLFPVLSHCRVTKSAIEIEVMRYCAYVASNAHVEVMRTVSDCEFEYELEAKFIYEIYRQGGCRRVPYTCICACGPNSAVLHYGHAGAPNDRKLLPTDMALLDMGAEYHGYCSDITCSFPISGIFTADQRVIYEGVLAAQRVVMEQMKPGVSWVQMHLNAEREVLRALMLAGVLKGGEDEVALDELCRIGMGAVFLPCGLGHLIGLDTHDVGGYIEDTPPRQDRAGLRKLRTARVLEPGMVLTNEPGCYFIDVLLDAALLDPIQGPHFNVDVLSRFRRFGGVRLEDVVLVTEDGVDNLTTCPRTVEEVEYVMAGGAWPPQVDAAPYLRRKWTKLAADGTRMDDIVLWKDAAR